MLPDQFYIFWSAHSPPSPASVFSSVVLFYCCAYICMYLTVLAEFLAREELGSLPHPEPLICLSAALSRTQKAIALHLLGHDSLSCVLWAEACSGTWSYWEGGGILVGMKGGSVDLRMGRIMEP